MKKSGKTEQKENGMIQISGCVNTQKIHLLSGIGSGCGYKLVVFQMRKRQRRHTKSIYCLEKRRICILQEICFFYADIKGKTLTNRRMEVLRAIAEKKKEEPVTVITTMDAFWTGSFPRMKFKKQNSYYRRRYG